LKFLDDMTDAKAAGIAARQMRQMADFAEGNECRRASLLDYFGEQWPGDNCGSCDVCLQPREIWDATTQAQKLLSCLIRIKQKSGFSTGLNHAVEVLAGANTEKIRNWGHEHLSTYGIGKDTPRAEWTVLGRQLVRLGYLTASPDAYQTLSVSASGLDALMKRSPILLTRLPQQTRVPTSSAKVARAGNISCDEGLFTELRTLRKRLADERGVPPYVVFGDLSLRQMARRYPRSDIDFLAIPGVGRQKLTDYGEPFLLEIATWLATHEPLPFPQDEAPPKPAPKMKSEGALNASALETLRILRTGKTILEIAALRDLSRGTIATHLALAIVSGEFKADPRDFYSIKEERLIDQAAAEQGYERLGPLHEALGGQVTYDKLHTYRAFKQRDQGSQPT
jgi:ATP-dependent DNA helicase RecQ